MGIGAKIALTGLIFLIVGVFAVVVRLGDTNISEGYKVVFGLSAIGGAAATLIGLLIFIWF